MAETMRISILALAAAMLASAVHAADRKLPPKFVGDWCIVNSPNDDGRKIFRRGGCRDSDGWMTVNVNGYRGHETACKVLNAVPKSGNYQVKFQCSGEGETWTENYRMSLDNKGRLIMQ